MDKKELKSQLHKLGHENPELRSPIQEIIHTINHDYRLTDDNIQTRYASRMERERAEDAVSEARQQWVELRNEIDKTLEMAQQNLDRPIGKGDFERQSYNDATIRASAILQELEHLLSPQDLQRKIKQMLRERKL